MALLNQISLASLTSITRPMLSKHSTDQATHRMVITKVEEGALTPSILTIHLTHMRRRRPDICAFRYSGKQYDDPREGLPFEYLSTILLCTFALLHIAQADVMISIY
jgi:hypothetical protein